MLIGHRQVVDFSTLSWVKKELDETLKEARQSLEAHVENPEDKAQLGFLTAYLHQVYGTLQMVELYGASLLTEEMERLQPQDRVRNQLIGGVPVDSEYVIFVIDTSGSMQMAAWRRLQTEMLNILNIYPSVKGIQVMNDMGDYMFSQYQGRWIPDTPARRKAINTRLAGWQPFSNSSPVEGIEAAIRRFYASDKRISLYVFGDDFSRGSIQDVIDTVARLNRADRSGQRRVRIHAVGFPVLFSRPDLSMNAVRFAALMRKLAEDNNGSFVGLNSTRN